MLLKIRMEAHSYLDEACQYLLPGKVRGGAFVGG